MPTASCRRITLIQIYTVHPTYGQGVYDLMLADKKGDYPMDGVIEKSKAAHLVGLPSRLIIPFAVGP
jgi:hypothetical protein